VPLAWQIQEVAVDLYQALKGAVGFPCQVLEMVGAHPNQALGVVEDLPCLALVEVKDPCVALVVVVAAHAFQA